MVFVQGGIFIVTPAVTRGFGFAVSAEVVALFDKQGVLWSIIPFSLTAVLHFGGEKIRRFSNKYSYDVSLTIK